MADNSVRMRRANRVITVSTDQVESYLLRGYDKIDENGKVTKKATGGKKYSAGEVNKMSEENENLRIENEELKVKLQDYMTGDKNDELQALQTRNEELEAELEKAREAFDKAKARIAELGGNKNNNKK